MNPTPQSARTASGNGFVPPAQPLTITSTLDSTLSKEEQTALFGHETTIREGWEAFVKVGLALISISEQRLYRDKFKTFDLYCRERWGFGRAYAYRLIEAAETRSELSLAVGAIEPTHESQLRPLVGLTKEEKNEAWNRAMSTAKGKQPTAAAVQKAANAVRGKNVPSKSKAKTVEPASKESFAEARELVAQLEAVLKKAKGAAKLLVLLQKVKREVAKLES